MACCSEEDLLAVLAEVMKGSHVKFFRLSINGKTIQLIYPLNKTHVCQAEVIWDGNKIVVRSKCGKTIKQGLDNKRKC